MVTRTASDLMLGMLGLGGLRTYERPRASPDTVAQEPPEGAAFKAWIVSKQECRLPLMHQCIVHR